MSETEVDLRKQISDQALEIARLLKLNETLEQRATYREWLKATERLAVFDGCGFSLYSHAGGILYQLDVAVRVRTEPLRVVAQRRSNGPNQAREILDVPRVMEDLNGNGRS